jgi:putative lipoprotein
MKQYSQQLTNRLARLPLCKAQRQGSKINQAAGLQAIHSRVIPVLFTLLLFAQQGMAWAEPMRGQLVFGHEARTIQLCGDEQVFWAHATGSVLENLQQQYRALARYPYEKVYVELDGQLLDQPVGSFAMDYVGTIEVHKLISISRVDTNSCHGQPSANTPKPTQSAEAKTYVFVCDEDAVYTVRTTDTQAWVFRPEGTLRLHAVPAEAGVKYADDNFQLWIEGEQARLGETDNRLLNCRNDRRRAIWERAKLDGADFRAVGNEPGWHLEILQGQRILLVADYGASHTELPLPEPSIDSEARITRWDAGELILEVIGRPCRDTMSGESFESTVVVTWGERTLRGCGRALH